MRIDGVCPKRLLLFPSAELHEEPEEANVDKRERVLIKLSLYQKAF